MISVEEAKRIMMSFVHPLPVERRMLKDATVHYAAADITSPHDHPLFDMSAVDGYAFASDGATERKLVGAVAAGEVFPRALESGECVRIFTGAMIPAGSDTVVMQEFVSVLGDLVRHTDGKLKPGGNVRRRAEQIRKDDVALAKGARIDAATIGLLASVGIWKLDVHRRPHVSVVISGGEFAGPKALEPEPGKVFNSNGIMLRAALEHETAGTEVERVADEKQLLISAIERADAMGNVVITTGGASVGDHDLMRAALEEFGAAVHFHGVAQKPGKPMLFATLDGKPVFSLPGNPRAVMILFWEYVLPFLRAMQGAANPWLKSELLPLTHSVELKGERAEFRAAQVRAGKATLLADEGSHMLRSLADADALACFPADRRSFKEGDPVEIHYLPR